MRYEGSKPTDKPILDRILMTLNYILVVIIAICFNYMFVNFLFR